MITIFDDRADTSENLKRSIDLVKVSYNDVKNIGVARATGDWWDFLEAQFYSSFPLTPEQRACSEPAARRHASSYNDISSRNYWLVDLELSDLKGEFRDKLERYFRERCRQDSELESRFTLAGLNPKIPLANLVGGLGVAAYGQQHDVCLRFISLYNFESENFQNLLHYLVYGDSYVGGAVEVSLKKDNLQLKKSGKLTSVQEHEFQKLFFWVSSKGLPFDGKMHKNNTIVRLPFISRQFVLPVTPDTTISIIAGWILGVLTPYAAGIGVWFAAEVSSFFAWLGALSF